MPAKTPAKTPRVIFMLLQHSIVITMRCGDQDNQTYNGRKARGQDGKHFLVSILYVLTYYRRQISVLTDIRITSIKADSEFYLRIKVQHGMF